MDSAALQDAGVVRRLGSSSDPDAPNKEAALLGLEVFW